MKKPVIAITMGDPAGIGPEITVGSLDKKEIYDICTPVVVGNADILAKMLPVKKADLKINQINEVHEAVGEYGTIDVIHLGELNNFELGQVNGECGQAAFDYIKYAVELCQSNQAQAMATAPINKESLKAAEVPYIGHTEMLAGFADVADPLTMFEVLSMRIFFLTRHLSLKDAIGQMTKERVHDYLIRCDAALKQLGVENRKFAVAGLNPHSGENGLFGYEEVDEIRPGIELAKADGIDVVGPVPADSVFHQALNGRYDAVLSLYHDQGHIAAKMTDFHRTISITNGLPFLRTSVDHGTAFDIAGEGIASSVSMEEAIKLAAKYAPHFINA
ncbi:4-hydroxythreonine-4-phosphate dehydrogenase PdxA [Alkalicoccobacillus gibsonii]|uniref:4-hydroxythreonine-4-phosphate dehydrogenase PdxA n=1 Tax=Alkalicoccobacillus gibsonii TaxID=79881 RepID=UPI001933DF22|nr:4-hydroxythreonine-4-phosphate dehydrogenase PdxA [Alkalicoccobacillus gibsonii]MBM0064157.1 4-hydroxythreonine-4-phosphate dehydrogenase PdxA [Alkalicoccobacillus gibsonii]